MATYLEIMNAASNADKAGDEDSARKLVQAALAGERKRVSAGGQPRVDSPQLFEAAPRAQDTFGDTVAEATAGPRAAMGAFTAGLADPSQSPTRQALPENTFAPSREFLGYAGDAGGLALSGLATAIAGGAGLVGELFGGDRTGERRLARDLIMMSMVAAPELAGVSSTARAAGGSVRATQRLARLASQPQSIARASDDLGVTPSLGMTGKTGGMLAASLEKIPGAGSIIAKDAARAVDEVEVQFNRIVRGIAEPQSARGAGEVLQRDLVRFRDDFRTRSNELYNKVSVHIPQGARVSLDNTSRVIQEAKEGLSGNPELARRLGLNTWDNILGEAQSNGMTWAGATQFRSEIGNALGKMNGPLADQSQARLKRLYSALTEDLAQAANDAGPSASAAWSRANRYYKLGSERIGERLDRLITADNPERAFEAFSAMAREGRAASDVRRMIDIQKSMTRESWDEVSASIVDRLGRARPGQQSADGDAFSPVTFLTEWSKLAPEAKRVLVRSSARQELDKLARVSEGVRSAGLERNSSNTGSTLITAATGAGLAVEPATAMGILAGANLTAYSMTRPVFLRALNRWARGDSRDIRRMANGSGPFVQDAQTVLRITAAETAAASNSNNPPRTASGL